MLDDGCLMLWCSPDQADTRFPIGVGSDEKGFNWVIFALLQRHLVQGEAATRDPVALTI